ncbi:MAG: 50S ribosomal protein L4 [Micavibrio sp.]|jgi:large subunit ribosomal protein L4|nr:MAG: 50S ribosomal protein L4 [Micavibrio sp.]
MKVAVKNLENKKLGDLTLDAEIFGVEVRPDILHRMVNWQLAKRRAGTHKVKTISEISGTGKKPFRQKGTGNARLGSLRGTQQRGGQVVHGPTPRSHETALPKKLRKLALRMALSSKQAAGKLIILDEAAAKTHKTKDMAANLKKLELDSALIIGGEEIDANFSRAIGNIPNIDVLPQQGANVYDILRRDTLVLTKEAVAKLEERLK